MIHTGDCVEVMHAMEPESVDAIVTDPPYGLEFMGKQWDRLWNGTRETKAEGRIGSDGVFRRKTQPTSAHGRGAPTYKAGIAAQEWHHAWATEALRVAKPGAYLLAFGGTRTFHRLAVALEDAGWIIRDTLVWGYASGFPKGRANLKPAWEPIVMARKPGPLRHLNIDECRIPAPENVGVTWTRGGKQEGPSLRTNTSGENEYVEANPAGRWPANIVLTDPIFDGGVEGVVGGGEQVTHPGIMRSDSAIGGYNGTPSRPAGTVLSVADSGTYSRFFLLRKDSTDGTPVDSNDLGNRDTRGTDGDPTTEGNVSERPPKVQASAAEYPRWFLIPKADRADREPVLRGQVARGAPRHAYGDGLNSATKVRTEQQATNGVSRQARENLHPTVKPTDLMRHLVRLVTPPGGTVLDPFLGSGTTGLACEMEGFEWIGIEKEPEYVAIATARLNGVQRGLGLDVPAPTPRAPKTDPDLSKHWPKRQNKPRPDASFQWKGWSPDEEDAA